MKPKTRDDIYDLLKGHITIAALGAALEQGLFWLLAKRAMEPAEIGRALDIPKNRCCYWLQLLADLGLVEHKPEGYVPSATARVAILDTYSEDTWSFLAREERVRLPLLVDLPDHLGDPRSLWAVHGLTAPNYFEQMKQDPGRARRFTRMLYELHQLLAETVARNLDLSGVSRLLDLGGGSGVISLKLLERSPTLEAMVLDIPEVCAAGREIAEATPHHHRIRYVPVDFERDPLPSGFDMVLACDSADPSKALFHKIHGILRSGGRFVIIDQFAPETGLAPRERVTWAFRGSLGNPDAFWPPTTQDVEALIKEAGFESPVVATRLDDDWSMIEAHV